MKGQVEGQSAPRRGLAIQPKGRRAPPLIGAVAGVFTVLAFTVLHQLLISDIWFSIIPMVLAGAVCGAGLAWSYDLQFRPAAPVTWFGFVVLHTCLLLGMGVASVALFDPVVPMAALMAANEPPSELIVQAMPLAAGFIVVSAAIPSLLWGRSPAQLMSNAVTSTLVITLLGLNVSVLGLVDLSGGSPFVVFEFLALLVLIMLGFAVAFLSLGRRSMFRGDVQ